MTEQDREELKQCSLRIAELLYPSFITLGRGKFRLVEGFVA